MKCAMLSQPGRIEIRDLPTPVPAPEEVLVDVELAALCGSDYSLYRGKLEGGLPLIPGHEAVGRISRVGDEVTGLTVGQRVVVQPNFSCRRCPICESGLANICPNKIRFGVDINGVFAEHAVVPAHYAWPVPDTMLSETAIFTEPVAVGYHALNKCPPREGQRVLVFGAGVLGLIMTQLVTLRGGTVFATDLVRQRLDLAEKLGAQAGFQEMADLEKAGPFDLIFETSGAPAALSHAIDLAAPGGTIIQMGLPGAAHPVQATPIVRKELTIRGSMIYTDEFPAVLELLETGDFKTEPLVSGIHPLEEIAVALEGFLEPDRVKTILRIRNTA